MHRRDLVLPSELIYPVDDWRWIEARFDPEFVAASETTFATGNGYLGMRGGVVEGRPAFLHGTFINGFHETWPIAYGERAYGFAKTGQTMVNVPDGKILRLYVDDEPFDIASATLLSYQRFLDFKRGTYQRDTVWETPSGKRVKLHVTRMVLLNERHSAVIQYELTVLDRDASVVVVSELLDHDALRCAQLQPHDLGEAVHDPRLSQRSSEPVLVHEGHRVSGARVVLGHRTRASGQTLGSGMEHAVETDCPHTVESGVHDGVGRVVISVDAKANAPIRVTKFLSYHSSRDADSSELMERTARSLSRIESQGFARLQANHQQLVGEFWERSDIEVSGAHVHPRIQQVLRWNLFQLLQATACVQNAGVPAKGLTGQAYDGHYFWDMEVYVLPFLIYTAPRVARNVLLFRYSVLDKARARARELNQRGALFAWRTISGEEASAYYAAGTAQYHINAAIAYAVNKYVAVTDDHAFLLEYGAEILVETARLWYDLGFFSERQNGQFCIHGVTGPDEYTTVVNNNAYTNMMARENLWYAESAVRKMQSTDAESYQRLVHRTGLSPGEVEDWQRAADRMLIPYDERLQIHPQDDDFLDREVWDFQGTPADKYPLLLHFHPLVIYRHQVIKQADLVLAMFLLGDEFTHEQKKRNFDYYDSLTTGDSSLSACIQTIVAAEIGYDELAIRYLRHALLMDLADVGGNVRDGVHMASIGGTWMAMVYGLAGMRDYDGELSFRPTRIVERLRFSICYRGRSLEVSMDRGKTTYTLRSGPALTLRHFDQSVSVKPGEPAALDADP